ncbi:MAG: lysylphosphatidylglycerol synthase transmembrane domain-containing protein [Elusimicrobiota bacterium]|jgi:hypothetical protein
MKKRLLFGFALAGVCLYYACRGLSIREMATSFSLANPRWILLAVGIYTIGFFLRALRWTILLEPIKMIPASQLFAPLAIGFFANNILPFRMGEFVRAHVTGRKFRISRTTSLGTVLLERICDTLSFLTTFAVVAIFFPFPASVEKGAAALGTSCALVIAVLIIIMRHQERFHVIVDRLPMKPAWRLKIHEAVSHFAHGVSGMRQLRHVFRALALSLVIWTIEGTMLYLMARAFQVPLHYPQSFFLLFFLGLSVTLPQAPGYVGTMELFGVTALALLGIPKQQGLPLILAIHGTQFIYICLFGAWAMWHEGLSVQSLMAKRDPATDPE